jgi:hypothetical protein
MKKFQVSDNEYRPAGNAGENAPAKSAPPVRETAEDMIRELQGIFCRGRYRSWVFRAERPDAKR